MSSLPYEAPLATERVGIVPAIWLVGSAETATHASLIKTVSAILETLIDTSPAQETNRILRPA